MQEEIEHKTVNFAISTVKLLALRCTLVVLAQKELRPFQQSAGRASSP